MYWLLITFVIGCECISINDPVDCNFCLRKCCQKGFYFQEDQNLGGGIDTCVQNDSVHLKTDIKLYDFEDGFNIGLKNCSHSKLRYFNVDKMPNFHLTQIEVLYHSHYKTKYNYMEYCLNKKNEIIRYFSCDQDEFKIPISAKITNSIFMLVTFLIFSIIPQRNIHEKAVAFHILCLIAANMILIVNEYYEIEDDLLCSEDNAYIILGCLLQYTRTASDFWLNTMCIEIWNSFSGLYFFRRRSYNERSLFIFLSMYAWGMPGLILLTIVLLKTAGHENNYHYPGIDRESCSFKGVPYHVFDNGPKLVLFVFNTVLNILTIINIQRVNRESSVATRADGKCQTCLGDPRCSLYWKLFFIMMYGFILHFFHSILVLTHDSPVNLRTITYFIYYAEFFGTTYGLAFFVTFVFKKRVWKGLKQRYYQILGRYKIWGTYRPARVVSSFGDNEAPGTHLNTLNCTKE